MSLLLNTGSYCSSSRTVAFSDARPQAQRRTQVHGREHCSVQCTAEKQDDRAVDVGDILRKLAVGIAATACIAAPMAFPPAELMPQAEARLTAGDPVKNARALLRYALPIKNEPARRIQVELEGISEQLRIPGSKALGPVMASVRKSHSILKNDQAKIIKDFAPDKKETGMKAIAALDKSLDEFSALLDAKDKQEIPAKQQEALGFVSTMEEAMVKGFPYEVPAQYASLPQLKGRATVDVRIKLREQRQDGVAGGTLRIVVDGFNAPVTAGDYVDLVRRGFYNGMEIQRADGFVVQTGDPGPPDNGFREGDHVRRIPFEVMVKGDAAPFYEETLEDAGRFNDQPVLPFNAYGTMALARSEFEPNSGSSQVFWLLKESELTPSGANLLDGRYAVFGYVVEGQDLLTQLQVGDTIEEMKVVDGLQYLQEPKNTA